MPVKQLVDFLDQNRVRYIILKHSPAFTSQEIAASAHVRGREMAKSVVVKVDGKMALAVMPASQRVDLDLLSDVVGAHDVTLATEREFKEKFPGCEAGAMPPFGNLFGMDVYVSPKLAEDTEIAFNAGSHTELIRLAYRDFERLVKPRTVAFAR